jgi:glucosamine--fructose-6-phosphate aminotransferase (isomerizing)
MAAEVAEQPIALARLLSDGAADIARVRALILARKPRFVIFAARGTSDHAALYAKYLVEVHWQLPAGLASPSTFTLYGSKPDLSDVLFVAISQSGGSPDLVGSVEAARACGAITVAVTNDGTSPLAEAAEYHLDVHAGPEKAVAATKSYTSQLLALYLLFVGGVAGAIPDAAGRTLALGEDAVPAAALRLRHAQQLLAAARGYSYATAREAALKIMETCYLPAQAFSGADLLHGPMAMVDAGMPVITVVSPGVGGASMAGVLERLTAVKADVVLVGPGGTIPVATEGIAEDLTPILEIMPLQQLAWQMALDRGGDPDRPRGLSKVTETW